MKTTPRTILLTLLFFLCSVAAARAQGQAQSPGGQQQRQEPEFIKQGRQLIHEGKLFDALALYTKELDVSPNSFDAHLASGSVLDLMGRSQEGRNHLKKAVQVASTAEEKEIAQRATAISYAFEGNCVKAGAYEGQVFEYYAEQKNFFQQGEIADEAGRVCIDAGDLDEANKWYEKGHDAGLKEPDIKPARVDLWNFRWEHAQARIAARRGDKPGGEKHVAAAKAILDKGTNPQQAPFFPYLVGYVAFYGGDYKTALDEFLRANQNDPFIQCMIGQTYEELGEKEKAVEYYHKAAAATSHNPPAAYAVPFAKKRLNVLHL